MVQYSHKRGDTFIITGTAYDNGGTVVDLTSYTIASKVRQVNGTLVQALTAAITTATAGEWQISATASQTAAWPITSGQTQETLELDVQFTSPSGRVDSTGTDQITFIRDITFTS